MPPRPEPLRRFPRYRSRDLEEVSALIHQEFRLQPIRVAQKSSRADVRVNCIYLPQMHMSYVQYGAKVEVHLSGPLDRYRILLPLSGKALSCAGGESVVCDGGTGISRPGGGGVVSLRSMPPTPSGIVVVSGGALAYDRGRAPSSSPQRPLQ